MIYRVARAFFSKKIHHELLNNPEFDKIYPQMLKHKPPTTILDKHNEIPYIQSLLKYKDNMKPNLTYSDAIDHNYRSFVEGHISSRGPLKELSDSDKKQINLLIDAKMEQLEQSGLSREEILSNGQKKGIPLSQDSFFQYLKNNYEARYIYLSPNEEYTVNKVIDLALRQELYDDHFNASSKTTEENLMKIKRSHTQSDRFINSKNKLEHVNELVRDEVIYHPKVISKQEKRQKNLRRVNNYDIHWRNTEFLIQFLNKSGKIRNRYQTYLDNIQQKKLARTIDVSRHMLLLPFSAAIQPYHRRSLTTLQNDIESFTRKSINIQTGQVYQSSSQQETAQDDYQLNIGLERPIDQTLVKAQIQAERDKQKRLNLKFDQEELEKRCVLSFGDRVQFKALREEELLKEEISKKAETEEFNKELEAAENVAKEIPTLNLVEGIISEFTYDIERMKKLKKEKKQSKLSKEESLKIINQIREKEGLQQLSY